MAFHRRTIREEEVELQDGKVLMIPILEITAKSMDELTRLTSKSIVELIKQDKEKEGKKSYKDMDFEDILHEMQKKHFVDSYNESLQKQEAIWRIMTGQEDVSWIHEAWPSTLDALNGIFIEINLPMQATKKNMSMLEEITKILSKPDVQKAFTNTLEGDTENPPLIIMNPTPIDS